MIADYIVNHQSEFWVILGFILLGIEVLTGFTTGVFLFAGLGALTSGLLMTFGLLPNTWIAGIASTGICSGVITALLWKPLKKLQGDKPAQKDNSSDFVGHEFYLDSEVTLANPGKTLYSGISWKVIIDRAYDVTSIQSGKKVVVTSVDVGVFTVKQL